MTTALAAPPVAPPTAAPRAPHRFSVDEFYRLGELGFFAGKPRVELIDGEIVEVMPPNPPHDGTLAILVRILFQCVPAGWNVRCQLSLRLSGSSPLPDACVVSGDEAVFVTRHPTPADVALVVEVADSTLMGDRRDKCRLYAQDGVVEYWIVNIPQRQVEVHTLPSGPCASPAYGSVRVFASGSAVPLPLPGCSASVAVDELIR